MLKQPGDHNIWPRDGSYSIRDFRDANDFKALTAILSHAASTKRYGIIISIIATPYRIACGIVSCLFALRLLRRNPDGETRRLVVAAILPRYHVEIVEGGDAVVVKVVEGGRRARGRSQGHP